MRSTSTVSFRSALLRKKVRTTSSSYSRRLAAVSGTTATVRGAVTRQKLRVLEASEVSAWSMVAWRRSMLTGWSRNAGSKTTLRFENLPMAVKMSRALASRKMSVSGRVTSVGTSWPGRGAARLSLISVSSVVWPSRLAAATCVRSWVRSARISVWMSPLPGFSSAASWNSISASSGWPVDRCRRALRDVILGGAQPGPVEGEADAAVVGPLPRRLDVLGDGEIVVLVLLGGPRGAQRAGGGAGAGQQAGGQHDGQRSGGEPVSGFAGHC